MNKRHVRLLVSGLSSGILAWLLLRRRTPGFQALPELMEERIALPVGGMRVGPGSPQEGGEGTQGRMLRKVGQNRRISVDGKLYGPLSPELVGQQVEIEERDSQLVVWSGAVEVGSFERQT